MRFFVTINNESIDSHFIYAKLFIDFKMWQLNSNVGTDSSLLFQRSI